MNIATEELKRTRTSFVSKQVSIIKLEENADFLGLNYYNFKGA